MPRFPKFSQHGEAAAAYAAAVWLSLLIAAVVLKLDRADLSVPFVYTGDGLWTAAWVKSLVDSRWFLHNRFLGMPGGMYLHDFPIPDNLHIGLLKLLCLFTQRFGLALNLYYLCGYPLTALTALYVLRRFIGPGLPSLVAALLYAFLPYHVMRGELHLFLASYYLVPLEIMVILWIYPDGALLLPPSPEGSRPRLDVRKLIAAAIICVAAGSAGVYYAFFGCYLLAIAGLLAWRARGSIQPLLLAVVLVGVLAATVVVNLAPSVIYRMQHGKNPESVQRAVGEGETYGLKIAQLVLPITQHRLHAFSRVKIRYATQMPLVNENDSASLGAVTSVAFLLLLVVPFWQVGGIGRRSAHVEGWSLLTWAALLLATIGGVGALFNLLVANEIRCYNRIAVFIAFFGALAFGAALRRAAERCRGDRRLRLACALGMLAILCLGILDQSSAFWAPRHGEVKEIFRQDAEFVRSIESSVPAGTTVFQLPYLAFPEAQSLPHHMSHYDPFRLYLHSRTLRWSYGAMKGRATAEWQKGVSALAPAAMCEALANAGFGGLCVDRAGYADNGRAVEAALTELMHTTPIVHPAGRWTFFDMRAYERTRSPETQAREPGVERADEAARSGSGTE